MDAIFELAAPAANMPRIILFLEHGSFLDTLELVTVREVDTALGYENKSVATVRRARDSF